MYETYIHAIYEVISLCILRVHLICLCTVKLEVCLLDGIFFIEISGIWPLCRSPPSQISETD